jgi:prepilin-type N-terminal cleavage/methylation domain-containing protein
MEKLIKNARRRRRSGESGFTLIELLVVIAVLAILAAIVIFNVTGVSKRGDDSACKTDLKSVQTASDAYYNDHSSAYPTSVDQLVPDYLHTAPTSLGTVTWDTHGTVTSSKC